MHSLTIDRLRAGLAGAILLLILEFTEPAGAAKFQGLGDLTGGTFSSAANAVSADGSVIAGDAVSASGPEAFRWTSGGGMAGIGDLPGVAFDSQAYGISANGSVVVGKGMSPSTFSWREAFRWTGNNGMVGLGLPVGNYAASQASGVSGDGSVIVGYSHSANTEMHEAFRWTSGAGMVPIMDLPGGGPASEAKGISSDGLVIVGFGSSTSGQEAFRWTSVDGTVGLGDLAGGVFSSVANAVSADGTVIVGQGSSASGPEAFRWTSVEGILALGDLVGGTFSSDSRGVSADGSTIVGRANSTAGDEAFVWDEINGMRSLADVLLPSVGAGALAEWRLNTANAISADGRTIVGTGLNPSGQTEAWVAYLPDEIYWLPEASGAWDSGTSWVGPFTPDSADNVIIDPLAAVTVSGPNAARTVNSLTIGGSGVGRATLRLDAVSDGDVTATSYAQLFADGELMLVNGRTFTTPVLYNSGLVRGTGTVSTDLINYTSGEVRVAEGESLVISGNGHSNDGKLEVINGSLEFIGGLTNTVGTGLITSRNATLRFQNGLTNNGSLMVSFGTSDVSGDITNSATGKIIVAGGAAATFYDDVTQNGTLQVIKVGSTNSTAVFAGAFTGSGGSSGGGDIFFLGDLRPGNSPAIVNFGNNIGFGPTTTLEIELGGTTPGSGYDQVHVASSMTLGGTLDVNLIDLGTGTFAPQAGNSFDILDWVALSGIFEAINLPMLDESLTWDTSQLYTTGVLAVVAPGLAGDYNQDGVVNAADYTVWRDSGGTQTGYDTWQANFGRALGSGANEASAVPEPATLALLLLVVSLLLAVNRSGRTSTDLRS
ncbi:MAG: PEP-CTERM sorting domain-containing protein [Pirellulales bacterium]